MIYNGVSERKSWSRGCWEGVAAVGDFCVPLGNDNHNQIFPYTTGFEAWTVRLSDKREEMNHNND